MLFTQKLDHKVTRVVESHIHKSDTQILADLESVRDDRRKRVANEAELEELRKLKLRDSTPPN